jgi:integrase
MGVYRRKDKNGAYYGPWIMQYPIGIDPRTGKTKYTSVKISYNKRVAELAYGKQMLEWEKKKHLGLEKKKEYTFRELVDWYLGLPKVKQKKSYKDDRERAEILKEEFGNHFALEIKPAMVEGYQHDLLNRPCKRRKNNYTPATVNRLLALMKRVFNLALREEFVEKNPCLKVTVLPENNKRDRIITMAEFDRIVSNMPKHAAQIVMVAYYTGMRAGEIFNLTWEKLNLREGYIDLSSQDTKTAEPRRIYMSESIRALFEEMAKVKYIAHRYVFTFQGKPLTSIRTSFRNACKIAGIHDFRFHDLRHTFNTNMRKAGVDRSVIMKITGHKSVSMFERYNTVDGCDAREAHQRLGEFLAKQPADDISTAMLLQSALSESGKCVTH